jgi:hypothetical protein
VRTTVRFGVTTAPVDGRRAVDLVAVANARMYEMRALTAPKAAPEREQSSTTADVRVAGG